MKGIITKTLAEIYVEQGYLQEAYEMFQALSEKDPFDKEIQKKLKELSEKLISRSGPSADRKIQPLMRWLHNIRKRREE